MTYVLSVFISTSIVPAMAKPAAIGSNAAHPIGCGSLLFPPELPPFLPFFAVELKAKIWHQREQSYKLNQSEIRN